MQNLAFACTLLAAMLLTPTRGYAEDAGVIARDTARIQAHLGGVEAYLRAQDTAHLTEAQRSMRAETLDRLHEYWVAGVFPRNTLTDYPTPVFVDPGGRACAVGYLMLEAGYGDAVGEIATTQNLAYVERIESAGVLAWLTESGITAQEAAWIQPEYNGCNDDCDCEPDPVCAPDGTTYVNPCFAENCFGVTVYTSGCCEVEDTIEWIGSAELGAFFTLCTDDPNEMTASLCDVAVEPPEEPLPVEADTNGESCAAAGEVEPVRWLWILTLVGIAALRRRRLS